MFGTHDEGLFSGRGIGSEHIYRLATPGDVLYKEPSELELKLEREDIANFHRKLDKYHCELDNAVRNMEVRWKVKRRRTEY